MSAPLIAELHRRAQELEERSEALASDFADGHGHPNVPVDEFIRVYIQQRSSHHLALRLASQASVEAPRPAQFQAQQSSLSNFRSRP